MKVLALNGSPRTDGNTAYCLDLVCKELEKEGIETEIVQLGGRKVFGCRACYKCGEIKNQRCVRNDDEMGDFLEKAFAADGIIIGSPVYFSNITPEVKAFIDRCGFVSKANGGLLKGKVGASVIAVRRAGGTFAYSAINFFFGISEMIVPGSSYWNLTIARDRGEAANDAEGVQTFVTLGTNIASLMKKLG
jgi:multimeric flavodoxin WrbA